MEMEHIGEIQLLLLPPRAVVVVVVVKSRLQRQNDALSGLSFDDAISWMERAHRIARP